MEELKLEVKEDSLIIEGEFDIELDLKTIHFGYPPEDENLFNRTAFEIKSYGEINLRFLSDLVKWINMKTVSRTPSEWPRWRLTFERLYDGCVCSDVEKVIDRESRQKVAIKDLERMRFF